MAEVSDVLVTNLNQRVNELTTELANTRAEAKKYRLERRDLKTQLETAQAEVKTLTTDRDEWKTKAEAAPSDLQKRVDDLTGQIRTRDHRDAWTATVGDQLADKVPLEELWAKLKYQPGEKLPTADEIKGLVGQARDSAPYLFKPAGQEPAASPRGRQPLQTNGLEASRGAPDTSAARVTVRTSQLRDVRWCLDPANKKMMADARAANTLVIVDD